MLFWTNRFAAMAVFGIALAGCDAGSQYKAAKDLPKPAEGDGHSHGEHVHGPHGGDIVELGKEEFHAEFLVDGKSHTVKVYLLGPDAKTAATTDAAEITIAPEGDMPPFVLKPAEGQPAGKASEFVLADEKIAHDLMDAGFVHGDLKIKIAGTAYNGHLDVHFDGDHAHDHGKEEQKKDDKPADSPTPIEPEKPAETKAEPK